METTNAPMELPMISLEDCVAMCGLSEAEVDAIAEHEHVPEMAAAALARYELSHVHGAEHIRAMIVDDIRRAFDDGRIVHAAELLSALRHFLEAHPEACVRAN